jgi:hypothetical protein
LVEYKPFKEKSTQRTELFTEVCFYLFGYTVMCFTNFVPDAETRFQIGWVSNGIISLNLVANIVLIIVAILTQAKNAAKSSCKKIKEYCRKK